MSKLLRFKESKRMEAGSDEAGRGCLAGPVFAAAVILPPKFDHPWLNDSKQLSEKKRCFLRPVIETQASAWHVAQVSPKRIDEINILNASIEAMHLAIHELNLTPMCLLIDGHRFHPYPGIPHSCEIKGDGRFMSIAAASILAKTHRDEYMAQIHKEYPVYNWKQNKGYPTKEHKEAIYQFGPTPHHRMSFRLIDEQLELPF